MNESVEDSHHPHDYHPQYLTTFVPITAFSLLTSFINISTIYIMIRSKSLSGAGNYPILSILLGSAIQSLITVPTYTFKRLNEGHLHREGLRWLCDFYRLPYFICEHMMKVSLLLVSCDRLVATLRPYRYKEMVTKKLSAIVLGCSWLVVLFVDLIPFLPIKQGDEEGCTYVPNRLWGVSVIILFNVVVFVLTFINYGIIWKTTAQLTIKDHEKRQYAVRLAENTPNLLMKRRCNATLEIAERSSLPVPTVESCFNQKPTLGSIHPELSISCQVFPNVFREPRRSSFPSDKATRDTEIQMTKNQLKGSQISLVSLSGTNRGGRCNRIWSGYDQGDVTLSQNLDFLATPAKTCKISTVSTWSTMSLRIAFEMKSTRTAFVIFIVYILCWGWLGIFYLVDNICGGCISENKSLMLERLVVKAVSFTSSVFLPLVYCWNTKSFWKEMKRFACVKSFITAIRSRSSQQSS